MCSLSLHYTVYALKAELDQLKEGLEFGGVVWTQDEAFTLMGLFCEIDAPVLSAKQVSSLFPPTFSPEGSNRRDIEEEVALHWEYFLRDAERGSLSLAGTDGEPPITLTLADILAFITGVDSIPPLGFEKAGGVEFLHEGGNFPMASTCALILRLPLHEDYEVFKEKMIFAILNAHGFFGNV